ncbi:MAG: homoserine O-acetyltransferase [Spirochaetota bacterium]|nr:homoserine O-acetyltransferase [Spirochaetota bacterium]
MNKRSIGIVHTEIMGIPLPDGDFKLERGGTLSRVEVAFERYGKLSEKGDNVILVCHALSGDAHAAGYHTNDEKSVGWWDNMIGPGKGIDTERFHVICSNILGGCKGTTGPSSINPATGEIYATNFPEITIGDMVELQKKLLDLLSIRRLYGVIGGSAGGLQVLEWCVRYPDFIEKAVCIAATESLSAQALSFDIVARNIIMADPLWNDGYYYGRDIPNKGLSLARMIGHITYLSKESMDVKFGRERREDRERSPFNTDFQVESYLDYQGRSFVERFDANSFLYITAAMDSFSLTERGGSLDEVFRKLESKFFIISVSSDWLYPAEQSKELAENLLISGKDVTYCNLASQFGHDSFLISNSDLNSLIYSFFEDPYSSNKKDQIFDEAHIKDFEIIARMIKPSSKLLDLGCGDGSFLQKMLIRDSVSVHGIDIDVKNIIECNRKGVSVFQVDLDEGLGMIPDNFYDYAILSRTLQEVHKPHLVLTEMLRVARMGIVSFINFANWKQRVVLSIKGCLPLSQKMTNKWYNTPNIHFLSLNDFKDFCMENDISILEVVSIPNGITSHIFTYLKRYNIGADRVIVKITKK